MRHTASSAWYSAIVWLPILAIVVTIGYFLCVGLMHLELTDGATSYFIGDKQAQSIRTERIHQYQQANAATQQAGVSGF